MTIELVKEDGQTLQGIPVDSMFGYLQSDGSIPCGLRFRDNQKTVVEEYDFADLADWQVAPELLKKIKDTCPGQP